MTKHTDLTRPTNLTEHPHGISMDEGLRQQKRAVSCAHWPLIRYNPTLRKANHNPFVLDSARPTISLNDFTDRELRYRMLRVSNPEQADEMMQLAQRLVDLRWKNHERMANWDAQAFQPVAGGVTGAPS